MFEIIKAGGWVMWPIIICSVVALAIIAERFWTLQRNRVMPKHLVAQLYASVRQGPMAPDQIQTLRQGSALGRILAAGLTNMNHSREVMKEGIEDTGRHVVHELERFINTLGTIAAITPLLGLLGTVIGMIKVFAAITSQGLGNPTALAGGISEALITTATGLCVAIPSLMFYRFFRGRIDELVIGMEQEAMKMVEVMHGEREPDSEEAA
ncbi:biopolymer transporter ExbB [Solemya pervernicosa gill symbiont]|uniref:Biopolymer transporter ExbB n=2 Tax=Gammaproteobacteria incertae sedis TaxID=118884 RepID=A0A1T2LAE4_9GAMM|nr:MotA/TolQ/ExbB proton channel family protein [Candidatus Reidiella endopervernicosa]OOZ42061.1 biopolymer transporter ExbB [Solemya pervernicosa gill symbiont]QKQ26986.1 MotA/TolQ/ExbB proton channel family protein [Candidatus Reidiella endopervernicosa]